MKLLRAIGALVVLASLAIAAPEPAAKDAKPDRYYLKTKLKDGSKNERFDGLYMEAYHTAAGFNVATFSEKKTQYSIVGYLNDTHQVFKLGGTPYGLTIAYPEVDSYAGWFTTEINAGYGTKGFEFNDDGYLISKGNERVNFGGWRVCNWSHGVPELFHEFKYYTDVVTANCAQTHLVAEPAD